MIMGCINFSGLEVIDSHEWFEAVKEIILAILEKFECFLVSRVTCVTFLNSSLYKQEMSCEFSSSMLFSLSLALVTVIILVDCPL